ncbi:phage tail tape measure protein [Tardiphaga sp. vice352]|uniref:phage tail tape measure protein n=1 Tax=unclassified Tardiphaga TaxID=2631404 RepID=UPI0011656B5E|nr:MULTISPECIES: phage tail tape measure protein [unclassified Tardiphaga]QDM16581.1 phage tail tape measure protein [Tardiphaga sp. vice278]QDM21605.1 phage tail tape measure protein [Tardiphaga sp. vice154]QDM26791.1 phage tail tape measure protein [Tardiphaga sp. vice304]QDM31854.1 phage tail tape measure protein [Tardiphaga sp. vice352]
MSDSSDWSASGTLDSLRGKTLDLTAAVSGFSKVMTQAFASSVTGGKAFEDVLKSLALKLSDLAVKAAFRPLESALGGGLQALTSGLSGTPSTNMRLFAAGGVIGAPSYFPLGDGGVGLAGEAGPEAIMPLQRGADGRLGVAGGGGGNNIHISIATPDAESFRRSESYLTGQIARAVARGQRSL